ncbi:MAG: tRNA (N(6)-L-threonylcarbamoyladenosine(37)-C(2))-methylthiotransferase MtaB [Chlamydiota bacterium]
MKKFIIITLGCRTNQYESQAYRDQLLNSGFEEGKEKDEISFCIVNSCSVTENAENSSLYEIRQLIKKYPQAKIFVTGCLVEKDRIFPSMERVTFVSNSEKENLISLVTNHEKLPFSIQRFHGHSRAFVKIQDGCNQFCSYCIVPFTRGTSRSRPIKDILEEVKVLVKNGYKEIVLTGIHIGDYPELSSLLCELAAISGLERIRLSSLDPNTLQDPLLSTILSTRMIMPNLHLSLQSGSNQILRIMNRRYTTEIFEEKVRYLVEKNPDFTITTDVIVGFPGETEEDFLETLQFCQKIQFAKVHIFPYSKRKKTKAASFPNQVPCGVVKERKKKLNALVEQGAFSLRNRYLGRKMKVLVEENEMGHTENFLPVIIGKNDEAGRIVEVQLIKNIDKGLVGEIWKSK